ncbi:hypothetical protein HPP92_008945 [Vanilla planifolia]|uniref:Amino acid transporter transmembrane domain-containing protein n=1 Tax=Vanilla planifolia TaxID=51239 RepID=A0A835R3D2_VANPL|nr:hypothetical protein HPP92_008945 [Vanilla planifolia]
MANMMVVVHVIGSYQIYAMPVFDMIETVLLKKLHFPPGITVRLVARSTYVGNAPYWDLKLDSKPHMHRAWSSVDDRITHWWFKADHYPSKDAWTLETTRSLSSPVPLTKLEKN